MPGHKILQTLENTSFVIVETKPGDLDAITDVVMRSAPDGYSCEMMKGSKEPARKREYARQRFNLGIQSEQPKGYAVLKKNENGDLDESAFIGIVAYAWVEGFSDEPRNLGYYMEKLEDFEGRGRMYNGGSHVKAVLPEVEKQHSGHWFIQLMNIDPYFQGKGIAKQLSRFCIERMKTDKDAPIFAPMSLPAQIVLMGLGFEIPPETIGPLIGSVVRRPSKNVEAVEVSDKVRKELKSQWDEADRGLISMLSG